LNIPFWHIATYRLAIASTVIVTSRYPVHFGRARTKARRAAKRNAVQQSDQPIVCAALAPCRPLRSPARQMVLSGARSRQVVVD
jgi:hypothetical protein